MGYLLQLPAAIDEGDGTVLHEWLCDEGTAVTAGTALAAIETGKTVVDLTAPQDGTLVRRLALPGTSLRAGDAVAVMALAHDTEATLAPLLKRAPPVRGTATAEVQASPALRRLAAELDVDLAQITGTGPHGRVSRRDIETAHERQRLHPAARNRPPAADQHVAHTPMRRVIARRMSEAKRTIPHFYLSVDCAMDALLQWRAGFNQQTQARLSVNDLIVRASALALREVPEANVSWREDGLVRHGHIDVAIAVATPGGLLTPILHDADSVPLADYAAATAELARRARDGHLRREDYIGGSMTVTNLGMYGVSRFGAIINPPQALILACGAAEERPAAVDGRLALATLMSVTLSADHRAVDGVLGARWLAAFRHLIEHPERLQG
ncbi:pyruvate dehydrogenase complex dihydrolipoamide acetyltransferase [Bordetella genomosp. 1]|uniref:Dihydrolipoamide acetyltransferase component of pyruvate dehydrogenase complex n=1 Tax=Bordetella genomosp. 1 TaxID=1395607 RepID=A0A261RVL7_9BORD|nr:dihydrolipoamide acetyltransferase family protein [Bordetella genomosp. 1]OZI28941.1 pyruvate dehydrogenase complex dihydrolipoamide acetyltransferase [Bordetella genomosp. 1]